MLRLIFIFGIIVAAFASQLQAAQVIDDFDSNPNQWFWVGYAPNNYVQPTGGYPGAWLDSGIPYQALFPYVLSIPQDGSPLRAALESTTMVGVSFSMIRLDPNNPEVLGPSQFSITLYDLHTIPGGAITAYSDGAPSPGAPSPWENVYFSIPSASSETPNDWVLSGPPDYTWPELMRNVDAISLSPISSGLVGIALYWRFGVDNIVVTYCVPMDTVFTDGFDGPSTCAPTQ